MQIDLRKYFEAAGQEFTHELGLNIQNQRDINGQSFFPIKPSTARGRASVLGATSTRSKIHEPYKRSKTGIVPRTGKVRKSIATSVPITRLLFTGKFWQNAFKFEAIAEALRVFVSPSQYPATAGTTGTSYADIVRYNNSQSPELNLNVQTPPLIFPNNETDVRVMRSWENFSARMHSPDAIADMKRQIFSDLKKQIVRIQL